jgi:transposase
MGSGDAFHRAYPHATQQALLEAHEHAFHYFGGVFKTLPGATAPLCRLLHRSTKGQALRRAGRIGIVH